ncbi:MAG TPA: DUF1015 domain-containing protein [Planctomycetota bacterium]|nr:DUF1015 domain-containing protein [Planctomycetota bacterium]
MATVKPFRALRYNQSKVSAPASALVCPPYDVIDAAMQDALYKKSEHNVVRIEFGKTSPEDKPGSDRYSRAAETFEKWIIENVLRQDSKPAFYLYEQTFDIASGGASRSQVVTRRGIFGACKLEPFGTGCVYPHEETFGGPKADRLALMQACEANLSPVFGLVPDETGTMTELLKKGVSLKKPDVEVKEENGVVNRLWVIDDESWVAAMQENLAGKNLFIADGHHRYETSCNYRNERRAKDNDPDGKLDKDYNYTLMMCVPMSDPGLYILPTHRLIQEAPGLSKEAFLKDSAALFDTRDASEQELFATAEEQAGPVKFGVIFKDGSRKLLTVKPAAAEAMKKAQPAKSDAWRSLDVSVLQELVLKGILKLSEEKVLRKEGVSYTPDTKQAIAKVTDKAGHYVMGFVLRPTLIEQVRDVSTRNEKMPQKSTYFYPKLLSGLVIRKL